MEVIVNRLIRITFDLKCSETSKRFDLILLTAKREFRGFFLALLQVTHAHKVNSTYSESEEEAVTRKSKRIEVRNLCFRSVETLDEWLDGHPLLGRLASRVTRCRRRSSFSKATRETFYIHSAPSEDDDERRGKRTTSQSRILESHQPPTEEEVKKKNENVVANRMTCIGRNKVGGGIK